MKKHLIVISVDAMVFEDLEHVKKLPNFGYLLEKASIIERVKTIYPSVTHPVHATLITGAPAGVTGIVNNLVFNPNSPDVNSSEWYNFLSEIKCDTLLHAAKRAGLTTASSTWPLVAKCSDVVDYLIPSALNYYFDGYEDNPMEVYKVLGANEKTLDIIEEAVNRYGYGDNHPAYDYFQSYCAAEIIKRYQPNLLLVHLGDVDSKRHKGGVFSEMVTKSLEAHDEWFKMIIDAVKEAGIWESTDFVVLSDHGQINITRVISPNVYLVDKGYIRLDEEGKIKDWDAYILSTGASAHVYLSRPNDEKLVSDIYELLSDMASEGIYGFEKVYTALEMREKYGLYGDFSFVLETDGYTGFAQRVTRPAVTGFDFSDYRYSKGTHGYEPHKGAQPTFFATGPSFKENVIIKEGNILNHAPTLASVLGLDLKDSWGKPVEEIIKR